MHTYTKLCCFVGFGLLLLNAESGRGVTFAHWPDTGQSICYDNSGQIACPGDGENFNGQDAQIQGTDRSYTPNSNTVTDNVTGLEWQNQDTSSTYTWQEAIDYCENLVQDGKNDWHLPTVDELSSLVDASTTNPAITPGYFQNLNASPGASGGLWTATPGVGNPSTDAWFVDLGGIGFVTGAEKDKEKGVLCVRNRHNASDSFSLYSDHTVKDENTGLIWTTSTIDFNNNGNIDEGDQVNWQTALAKATQYSVDGYTDWRLPNRNELQTILDYSRKLPAVKSFFVSNTPNIDGSYYWSSTIASSPDKAWSTNLGQGGVSEARGKADDANKCYVRLVRSIPDDSRLFTLRITGANGINQVTIHDNTHGADFVCKKTCFHEFPTGTNLTLTPSPDKQFVSWGDDCATNNGQITLTGAKTCTANFKTSPWVLFTPSTTGMGRR